MKRIARFWWVSIIFCSIWTKIIHVSFGAKWNVFVKISFSWRRMYNNRISTYVKVMPWRMFVWISKTFRWQLQNGNSRHVNLQKSWWQKSKSESAASRNHLTKRCKATFRVSNPHFHTSPAAAACSTMRQLFILVVVYITWPDFWADGWELVVIGNVKSRCKSSSRATINKVTWAKSWVVWTLCKWLTAFLTCCSQRERKMSYNPSIRSALVGQTKNRRVRDHLWSFHLNLHHALLGR